MTNARKLWICNMPLAVIAHWAFTNNCDNDVPSWQGPAGDQRTTLFHSAPTDRSAGSEDDFVIG